ncbi:hypothetical protein KFE98_15435 [bacterium SCSIO 12741]|nr:hypothetical protein KFE98_15435 [bacterium SCSIO 12741]
MKQLFTFLFLVLTATYAQAQCTPDPSHTSAGFYSSAGKDTLPGAEINSVYDEVITIVIPPDTNTGIPGIGTIAIDSVVLTSVQGLPVGLTYETLSDKIEGGKSGCVRISGKPTNNGDIGTVRININSTVYLPIIGAAPAPAQVVEMEVKASTVSVKEVNFNEPFAVHNAPNPFFPKTTFYLNHRVSDHVQFTVLNVVGERVIDEIVELKDGESFFHFESVDLPGGIYVYSIKAGDNETLGRMMIADH